MKIGVAALGRISEDTGGKNYVLHFFREVAIANVPHSFTLFLSEGERKKLDLPAGISIVEIPNSSRTPLHKVFGEQWELPSYIREAGVDVMYYPGNFVSLRSEVPAVLNIRATPHFYGTQYGVTGIRSIIRRTLMPRSAKKARAIITPSEDIKRDVVRFMGIDPKKITVVPHGVDLTLFDGDRNRGDAMSTPVLKRYDLSAGNYLLYVSALWRYKNQDALIRAHAKLVKNGRSDLVLVLAGKGTGTDPQYLAELRALPRELGTSHLVRFTGALEQSELRFLYANAAAFVFPSSYESFGNPIFESWASGIPIATANVHSFPEVVEDAGLLFDPKDVQAIARSVERLLSDASLRAELIAKGRERVKYFTWHRALMRTLSVIESVSENGRRL